MPYFFIFQGDLFLLLFGAIHIYQQLHLNYSSAIVLCLQHGDAMSSNYISSIVGLLCAFRFWRKDFNGNHYASVYDCIPDDSSRQNAAHIKWSPSYWWVIQLYPLISYCLVSINMCAYYMNDLLRNEDERLRCVVSHYKHGM